MAEKNNEKQKHFRDENIRKERTKKQVISLDYTRTDNMDGVYRIKSLFSENKTFLRLSVFIYHLKLIWLGFEAGFALLSTNN